MSQSQFYLGKESLLTMRERTKLAQEAEAGKLFSQKNVNAVLSEAAMRGQTVATFEPNIPMDLSGSLTARAAVQEFQKAGFLVEWKKRQKPDCEPETYLRVSWGPDAKNN